YLVMAAWLAYLKSKLLLPKAPKEEDGEEEDEEVKLMRRLMRREAMNQLTAQAEKLFEGDLLGRDVFVRGEPERRAVDVRVEYTASMLDLLRAYAKTATKRNFQPLHLERRRAVVAIDEALLALRRALEEKGEWDILERYLPERWRNEDYARSAVASTFSAALELCKHGRAVLRQDAPFEPIHLRMRTEEEREALMRAAEQRVDGPSLSEALGRLNEKGHAA
ncbi:MAG: segregation/condensation protein A, partial [Pseudomonadota bacterium]